MGFARKKARLKEDAVPTIFTHKQPPQKRKSSEERNAKKRKVEALEESLAQSCDSDDQVQTSFDCNDVKSKDSYTQTDPIIMIDKEINNVKSYKNSSVQCSLQTITTEVPSTNEFAVQVECTELDDNRLKRMESFQDISLNLDDTIESENRMDTSFEVDDIQDETETETEPEEDDCDKLPEQDKIFFVQWSQLRTLFESCFTCKQPMFIHTTDANGSLLRIIGTCVNGHENSWESQPCIRKVPRIDMVTAAATLCVGNTYGHIKETMDASKIQWMSKRRYYDIQKQLLLPSINKVYCKEQEAILVRLVCSGPVNLSGDSRCDSPGYSAKYGTYTVMDPTRDEVVAFEVVHVSEAGNSNRMEKHGMVKVLERLEWDGVEIRSLTTDRHKQVRKYLRTEKEDIVHQFDVWHVSKNIKKKLALLAKKKTCKELLNWVKSVVNHFWWACATSKGDPVMLKEKWLSLLNHVQNEHSWPGNSKYHQCAHPPLSDEESSSKKWLTYGSPAYHALETVVREKALLKDLPYLREFRHTGQLEVYHSLINKYCPKRLHFSYPVMVARTQLAALDQNSGSGTEHAHTKKGDLRFKIVFPKNQKNWVAKKISTPKVKSYISEIMEETIKLQCADIKGVLPNLPSVPRNIATEKNQGGKKVIGHLSTRFQVLDRD